MPSCTSSRFNGQYGLAGTHEEYTDPHHLRHYGTEDRRISVSDDRTSSGTHRAQGRRHYNIGQCESRGL